MIKTLGTLILCSALCSQISRASDKKSDETDLTELNAAIAEAVDLFQNDKYAEAAESFRRANAIRFNWKVLYNIGQCEIGAKHPVPAIQALKEYLKFGAEDVPPKRRLEVETSIENLKKQVGFLEVSGPKGAQLLINETPTGTMPIPNAIVVPANAPVKVSVQMNDEQLFSEEITLQGGQAKSITVETPALTGDVEKKEPSPAETKIAPTPELNIEPVNSPQPTPSRHGQLRKISVITMGAGGALMALSLTIGGIGLIKANSYCDSKDCENLPRSEQKRVDRYSNIALTVNIMLGVGAAATIAGGILFMRDWSRRNKTEKLSTTISPVISNTFWGTAISRQF